MTNIRVRAESLVNELCDSHSWVIMSSSELGSEYKEEEKGETNSSGFSLGSVNSSYKYKSADKLNVEDNSSISAPST